MARKPRVYYEGALYHVISRGNNKQYIFIDDELKELYLIKVKKYLEKYDCKLYAYVIMDNHAHLLIEVGNIPLSKPMQLIQQTFTQYYNKLKKRTGHVFEQRYKAVLCDKDKYLLTLIKYIHKNPVRAGMGDINYSWSSHREYKEYKANYCNIQFPLSIFSNNSNNAIREYLKYMEEDEIIEDKNDYELIPKEIVRNYKEEFNINLSYEKILEQFIEEYKISHEDLSGRARSKKISMIKKEFIKKIVKNKVISQRELSDKLRVSEQTISRIANEV